MCRLCCGHGPDPLSFGNFEKKVIGALDSVYDETGFVDAAKEMDRLRFDTGDEWGEPRIFHSVRRLILSNPDPNEGLLLFTLACWLDLQAPYVTVWTTYLRQAKNWMDGKGPLPRGDYLPTKAHLRLTKKSVEANKSLGQWFALKINGIAEKHGPKGGNVYRLAGEMCSDLYSKPQVVDSLKNGILPSNFSGGDHKRFWMFLMFLRRDNSLVKCLFTRALNKTEAGQRAVQYWYDPRYFDPVECELPVDRRVSANWNSVFGRLGRSDLLTKYTSYVANRARSLAQRNGISPSVFDSILFYNGIGWPQGCARW